MKVLVSKITLVIPYSYSLKDKRRVIKALKDRVWSKFRVSMSEIEELDSLQRAVLGTVYVSNDRELLDSMINKIVNLIETSYPGILYDYIYTVETY